MTRGLRLLRMMTVVAAVPKGTAPVRSLASDASHYRTPRGTAAGGEHGISNFPQTTSVVTGQGMLLPYENHSEESCV